MPWIDSSALIHLLFCGLYYEKDLLKKWSSIFYAQVVTLYQDLWPHLMHLNTKGTLFLSKTYGVFGLEQIMHFVIFWSFLPSFTGKLWTRLFVGSGCLVSKVNWLMAIYFENNIWRYLPICGMPLIMYGRPQLQGYWLILFLNLSIHDQ